MPLISLRGDEVVTDPDLRAHLAAVLRLENIGAFLGAGSSVGAGGQTIAGLWKTFLRECEDSATRFANDGFIQREDADIRQFEGVTPREAPNVENLLDTLEVAKIDWERRKPNSRSLRTFKQDIAKLLRCVIKAAILSENPWQEPTAQIAQVNSHIKLLQRLIGARQPGQPSPWLFTTNYDLAVEWAAEKVGIHVHTGFVGIHNRTFSPQSFDLGLRNTLAKGEARFGCNDVYLAKLHGSLTWRRHNHMDFRELAATEAWADLKPVIDGDREPDDSLMVFPRAAKYRQTVGYLSGELFRRYSDFLARPQTCLLVFGYSFGDEHLNRVLKSALLNPTLQLVIFLPEFNGDEAAVLAGLKESVRQLLSLGSPRITVVGGGASAFFEETVKLLPDPILYDLTEREMRERMNEAPGEGHAG